MDIVKRIVKDEAFLLKKGPEALVPPDKKLPSDFRPDVCKVIGYIPDNLRATYSLIDFYSQAFKETEAEADRMELVALKAAVEYKWRTRLAECCENIEKPSGSTIRVLGDWSIAVIVLVVGR